MVSKARKLFIVSLLLAVTLMFPAHSLANALHVMSYVDNTTIGIDDVLKFTLQIKGENISKIGKFQLPDIEGFTITGSDTASSSSYVASNGKMSRSSTRSYIYTLRAKNIGTFLIPPITISFEKQNYTTDPISITVVQGSTKPAPPVAGQFGGQTQSDSEQITDNIFIAADVPKRKLYRGEPLIVSYKLYSRYDISSLAPLSEPSFVGFWKDDIHIANRMNFRNENYKGKLFNAMLLRTIALYPSQSGTLTIPSYDFSADILIRRSLWDFPSTRKLTVRSKPIGIEVKELPNTDKPAGFTGAVGNFQVSSEISDSSVNVGDPITITIKIAGSGNFKHFNPPIFADQPFLRILDPEVTTTSEVKGNIVTGSTTIKYPALLTQDGDFELPPIVFSFFDPVKERYNSIKTASYKITAQPVDFVAHQFGHSQKDVTSEGTDILYICRESDLSQPQLLINSKLFWILGIVALLSIPAALLYGREKDRLLNDVSHQRQRLAKKILRKYLKLATEGAKTGNASFYTNAANGLSNYLTDILKIPRGSTTEIIIDTMTDKGYSPTSVGKVNSLLKRCAEARFKPGGFNKEMIESDYQELIKVINEVGS